MGNKSLSMWAGFECMLSVFGLGYLLYLYNEGLWLDNEPFMLVVFIVILIRATLTYRAWWCNTLIK